MWHYVALFMYKAKILIHCVFDKFCFFLHCGTMWHYVALCVTKKNKNNVFLYFCVFLHCGTMWHYVALFLYKAKIEIHCLLDKFCFFFALWHYVALCGTICNSKK